MKTDDLINALAAGIGPIDPRAPARRLLAAATAGVLLAAPLLLGLLGLNRQLAQATAEPMFWVKLAFVVAVAAAAFGAALRTATPGASLRRSGIGLALPFAMLWLLAAAALAVSSPAERTALLFGDTWLACPLNIALLSAPALLLALAAMRSLAPTRLRLAGASAGLLAGGLGAIVYTLHCPELAAPFLAAWYVLGMLIPTAIGAALGGRLLRW